jgi:hypothetical protein
MIYIWHFISNILHPILYITHSGALTYSVYVQCVVRRISAHLKEEHVKNKINSGIWGPHDKSSSLNASRLTAVARCSRSWFHRRMAEGIKENFMVSVLQNGTWNLCHGHQVSWGGSTVQLGWLWGCVWSCRPSPAWHWHHQHWSGDVELANLDRHHCSGAAGSLVITFYK